jgi:hypothetical protein
MAALLNTVQAAAYLGRSVSTMRNWRVQGYGPAFVKVGRGKKAPVGYTQEDLDAYIAAQRKRSTSDEEKGETHAGER